MLINLSNHPSSKWSPMQIQRARELFGSIIDFPFPSVNPSASLEEIKGLVKIVAEKVLTLSPNQGDLIIHVMGELTFCYQFVDTMRKKGIRCVASTTERIAENSDNIKTSFFNFVDFRDYY